MSETTATALPKYIAELRAFDKGDVTASDFEAWYLATYLKDPTIWDPWVFDILDRVFADVDEYVDDPELRERAGGLDTEQLRESVRRALAALES